MNIGTHAGINHQGRNLFLVDGVIRVGSQFVRPTGYRSLNGLEYRASWNDATHEGTFTGRDAEEAAMRYCWNQLLEFGRVLEAKQAGNDAWEARRVR
jgi:hypothetical protein